MRDPLSACFLRLLRKSLISSLPIKVVVTVEVLNRLIDSLYYATLGVIFDLTRSVFRSRRFRDFRSGLEITVISTVATPDLSISNLLAIPRETSNTRRLA